MLLAYELETRLFDELFDINKKNTMNNILELITPVFHRLNSIFLSLRRYFGDRSSFTSTNRVEGTPAT